MSCLSLVYCLLAPLHKPPGRRACSSTEQSLVHTRALSIGSINEPFKSSQPSWEGWENTGVSALSDQAGATSPLVLRGWPPLHLPLPSKPPSPGRASRTSGPFGELGRGRGWTRTLPEPRPRSASEGAPAASVGKRDRIPGPLARDSHGPQGRMWASRRSRSGELQEAGASQLREAEPFFRTASLARRQALEETPLPT